jgi:hypothetical protein
LSVSYHLGRRWLSVSNHNEGRCLLVSCKVGRRC